MAPARRSSWQPCPTAGPADASGRTSARSTGDARAVAPAAGVDYGAANGHSMTGAGFSPPAVDALPPPAMALRADDVGRTKAALDSLTTLALAGLAGAFIAMGAVFSTTVSTGTAELPYGV